MRTTTQDPQKLNHQRKNRPGAISAIYPKAAPPWGGALYPLLLHPDMYGRVSRMTHADGCIVSSPYKFAPAPPMAAFPDNRAARGGPFALPIHVPHRYPRRRNFPRHQSLPRTVHVHSAAPRDRANAHACPFGGESHRDLDLGYSDAQPG